MRPARRVSALCAAFDGGGRPRPAVLAAGPMRMATLALAVDQTTAAAGAAAARAGELPPRTAGRGQGRPAAGVRSSPAAGAARLDATPGVVDAPASPRPASSTPLQCAVPASLPSAAHPRKSHRRSDQGADWPAHSARTVHATVRSSGTHPRPPCPPNPPPARPYPTHVDGNRRRSEQTRRSRRAAPAQQAGTNRISAVAVTRATSTYRLGTSVRRSEAPRCCRSREPGSVCGPGSVRFVGSSLQGRGRPCFSVPGHDPGRFVPRRPSTATLAKNDPVLSAPQPQRP